MGAGWCSRMMAYIADSIDITNRMMPIIKSAPYSLKPPSNFPPIFKNKLMA